MSEIKELITKEIQILKPKMLGIKWFSVFFIATTYSEYNGVDGFDSASKCLAFAELEGGTINLDKLIIIFPWSNMVQDI